MRRATAAGAVAMLLFAGTPRVGAQTQTPVLTGEEKQQIDVQLADRHLQAITVSALTADNQPVRDVLRSLSTMTGLTTQSDQNVPELDTLVTVNLKNLRLEEALGTLLGANKIAFAVIGAKSVFLYSDTPANRQKFGESVRTFVITKADPGTLAQMLAAQPFARDGIRPTFVMTRQARTISVRASGEKMDEIAKFIAANDK